MALKVDVSSNKADILVRSPISKTGRCKSSKSLHVSISIFFKVNRHESFQIFGRFQIFLFRNMFCRITCFCLKVAKMAFLQREAGVFRFFFTKNSYFSSVLQSHA